MNGENLKNHYIELKKDDIDFYTGVHDEALLDRLLTDYKFFIETFLVIKTKDKKLIPFILNPIQIDLYNRIHGKPYYYGMILKARQMGCSTFILAYYFVDTILNPNTNSVCVAHEQDAVHRLFDIIHLFYNNLPDVLKPPRKYSNRKELYFSDRNDPNRSLESRFFVGTAGAKGFGRSATIQNLHLSEYAFYEDPDSFLAGIIDAVPLNNSRIIIESTANGLNHFYHEYKEAVEGKTMYEAIFYPWYMFPEYKVELTPQEHENWVFMDEEERYLYEKLKLTKEQLKFRRIRIGLYRNDVNRFKQEYPSTWQEAFLAQTKYKWGLTPDVLDKQLKYITPPEPISNYLTYKLPQITIWEDVKNNIGYVVAVDVAEGSDTGHLSAIEVFKYENGILEQVAEFSDNVDLITLSRIVLTIAVYYNNAFVIVERNNHGYTILNNLMYLYNYPVLYKDENNKEGVYMTKHLKRKAEDNLIYLINSEILHLRSEKLLNEIRVYATTENKKKTTNEFGHFDKLSALLLICATYPEIIQYIIPRAVENAEKIEYIELHKPIFNPMNILWQRR